MVNIIFSIVLCDVPCICDDKITELSCQYMQYISMYAITMLSLLVEL